MAEEKMAAVEETAGPAKKEAAKKNVAAPAKAVTAVKKDDTKPGFFQRIGKWFRDMKSELKKVVWPTPQQLTKNSLIALVVMIISGIGIWAYDELAQLLVRALFTIAG